MGIKELLGNTLEYLTRAAIVVLSSNGQDPKLDHKYKMALDFIRGAEIAMRRGFINYANDCLDCARNLRFPIYYSVRLDWRIESLERKMKSISGEPS